MADIVMKNVRMKIHIEQAMNAIFKYMDEIPKYDMYYPLHVEAAFGNEYHMWIDQYNGSYVIKRL